MVQKHRCISLFSGAGGMDVGFKSAGVDVIWANEMDKDACATFRENHKETLLREGDILQYMDELTSLKDIDIIFGGPPCQGFSVAGKMDPTDERSKLIWTFMDAVRIVRPKAFILENVKALAALEKWRPVREKIISYASDLGYVCYPVLLNASHYGVPQKRERVFFIGFLNNEPGLENLISRIITHQKKPKSIRETLISLGPAGSETNPLTCTAKITLATKPIMRKSPYAGMIFNGMGRPLDIDNFANTLPASMGGNKTPIIDEVLLHNSRDNNWIEDYHKSLINNQVAPQFEEAPSRLRRITINEAALIQTFPKDYIFRGSKTSIYKQIGNAVPCLLAEAVARAVVEELNSRQTVSSNDEPRQLCLEEYINV
ncbi:DNA cytosine methyltransferase [Paenibacillus sp. BIC5C1]|uniref:DNA cytosine methyltransferase n=1 Tax=Paenibacillus sp. BIC5C1 TaxID=3078263 RepID=UPI0028EE4A7C|nr:DNA cytosine methyltransferase [Paenibacillus sp. BIC5C1]